MAHMGVKCKSETRPTGDAIAQDAGFKPAMQTILHNAQYPSHITLPIVPR